MVGGCEEGQRTREPLFVSGMMTRRCIVVMMTTPSLIWHRLNENISQQASLQIT